jgi:hypothetical protein
MTACADKTALVGCPVAEEACGTHGIQARDACTYHVLAVTRVALDHHGGRLKDSVGDLSHGQLLVVCLLS